jgi:hypothetical protein
VKVRFSSFLCAALICQAGYLFASSGSASAGGVGAPAHFAATAATKAPPVPAFDECGFSGKFEKLLVRPKSIIIACGDGNTLLKDLKWASWGQTAAAATGVDTWNKCVPDCASSKTWESIPVTVTLTHPVPEPKGPPLFGLLTVRGHNNSKSEGMGKFVFLPNACGPSNRKWTESEGQPCPTNTTSSSRR